MYGKKSIKIDSRTIDHKQLIIRAIDHHKIDQKVVRADEMGFVCARQPPFDQFCGESDFLTVVFASNVSKMGSEFAC